MAKRFIETGYYNSPFIRSLEGTLKSLHTYIICNCSPAGIWTVDLEVAGIYTGYKYTMDQVRSAFLDTGKAMDLMNGKWFFASFVDHQYPKGLSEKNPAHNAVILELERYQLLNPESQGTNRYLNSTSRGTKVMVKDKVMGKVEVTDTVKVKPRATEKSDSLLSKMETLWGDHLTKEHDIAYYANGQERKAMNEIGKKLLHQVKDKMKRDGIIDERTDDEHILEAWQFMLNKYSKWTDFNKQFTKLNQINGQFTNIIADIKSGGRGKKSDQVLAADAGIIALQNRK